MLRVLCARSLPLLAGGLFGSSCGPPLEPPQGSCGGQATAIGELQGTGEVSPHQDQLVTVEGIVTLITSDAEPAGFYLQSSRSDDEPRSSEALFIHAGAGRLPAVTRGQRVRLRGRVLELAGVTALGELELVEPCGTASLPRAGIALGQAEDAESWENMVVHSRETWTLLDTTELESADRVLISARGRSYAAGHPLGQVPITHWALSGLGGALGAWLREDTVSQHLRLGARASGLTAVVRPGSPALLLASEPAAFRAPPAPAAPVRPSSALRVAALNLDNYFGEPGSRGARTERELARQRAKLVALLQQLDADVLVLSEIGNTTASGAAASAPGSSLAELLAELDTGAPDEPAYRLSESTTSPGGVLRSAIAYRARQLQPAGAAWLLSDDAFRRAPLVQRFVTASGGFTLAAVHLKSKVCSGGAELVGPEGCGAQQRLAEARALLRALSALPAEQAEQALLIGDFNADALEAPLLELRAGGLLDLFQGLPAAERYSYVFEGKATQLDHALAGPALAVRLRGAQIWHINADEPALLDYELGHATRAYAPDARRASDHDPIVIDLTP